MVFLVGAAGGTLSGWGTGTTARCDASRQVPCNKLRQEGASGRNLFFQRVGPTWQGDIDFAVGAAVVAASCAPARQIMDNRR
jgi:hypothetical protein